MFECLTHTLPYSSSAIYYRRKKRRFFLSSHFNCHFIFVDFIVDFVLKWLLWLLQATFRMFLYFHCIKKSRRIQMDHRMQAPKKRSAVGPTFPVDWWAKLHHSHRSIMLQVISFHRYNVLWHRSKRTVHFIYIHTHTLAQILVPSNR